MSESTSLPEIAEIKIRPFTVDEWYGVHVEVKWKEPLAPGFDEDEIVDYVLHKIVTSKEWKEFYSRDHIVTCQMYEDGPLRTEVIPRFSTRDFSDWEIWPDGGWFSASTR